MFYFGVKPNLFVFEEYAESIDAAAAKTKTGFFWYIYGGNDYSDFDFDWRPAPWEKNHVHIFPSQWQRNGEVYLAHCDTVTNKEWNFRTEQTITRLPNKSFWHTPTNIDDSTFDYSWHPDVLEDAYEYHFPTQWQNAGGPVYCGTAGVKLEYRQSAVAIPDMSKWQIPIGIDDSEFDYSWHPNPLEPAYEYHFPTQHQRDGGPIYRGNAGIKYVNAQKIRANSTQIFYMDFLNPESDSQFQLLQKEFPDIKRTRYVSDHLNVFKRIMNMATTEFVWIISSICNYDFFDFTWHPPEEQREMIHCFSSNNEKRGDTFRIHVPSFSRQMIELELLDWFNVINYVDRSVPRFSIPRHVYDGDDLISEIKNYDFKTPYVTFTNQKDLYLNISSCIWSQKDRVAIRITRSGATTIVPRDAREYIKTQLYDYPYLEKKEYLKKAEYYGDKNTTGLDIVYISNGEPDEAKWYEHLVYASNYDNIAWVRGVNGRVAAYQAAARHSTTPWFFAVFAKLEVELDFDWSWQPDFWQEPKHYIFNARNPVNGLEYGHQGIIAYNKRLVLENNTPGIDFTLSQPHESVPMLSGTAHFNQDSWMTWRTAFREVLKLRLFMDTHPTLETEARLKTWCTHAVGNYSNYCLDGANDAVAYYNEVQGDPALLQLSFDWAWLKERFNSRSN